MKTTTTLLALAAAVLLAACADNPEMAAPTPPLASEVPASATASVSAYTSFAASLAPSETQSPLGVNHLVPPTSETEKPQAL